MGDAVFGGALPRSETATITPSGESFAMNTAFGTLAFSLLFPTHSEGRSDEESLALTQGILRFAQDDRGSAC